MEKATHIHWSDRIHFYLNRARGVNRNSEKFLEIFLFFYFSMFDVGKKFVRSRSTMSDTHRTAMKNVR